MDVLNPVNVGIDIGQLQDPAAVSVAEAVPVETGKHRWIKRVPPYVDKHGQFQPGRDTDPVRKTEYFIRHIARFPLGTSYPKMAEQIADLLCSPNFAGRKITVFMDATGVGRPVYDDLCEEARLHEEARKIVIMPITFTNGPTFNLKTGLLGKDYMVSRLQSLLQNGRIHAPDTKEVQATLEELKVYETRITPKGNAQHGAFEKGKHDDLATALGLSCLVDPHGTRAKQSERVY